MSLYSRSYHIIKQLDPNLKKITLIRNTKLLDWPKSSLGFYCKMLWKNLNELFGKPNISNFSICFETG